MSFKLAVTSTILYGLGLVGHVFLMSSSPDTPLNIIFSIAFSSLALMVLGISGLVLAHTKES